MKYYSGRKHVRNGKLYFPMPRRSLRSRWRRLPAYAKILVIAVVAYLLMIIIAASRFQGTYDSIRQIAVSSGLQTSFNERDFFAHVKFMVKNPRFAWMCLWTPEDDMFTATFLAFDIDAAKYKTQSEQAVQNSGNRHSVDIRQPTDVETENYIEHNRTDDGRFSSTVHYSFETDFLIDSGANVGDICSLRVSTVYRDKTGGTRVTSENIITNIVAGSRVSIESVILDPDGYISVDDIVGYNIE